MSAQPEALRLAGILGNEFDTYTDTWSAKEAAAELRRLHQSEQEGWRYASELEEDRKRLAIENQGLRAARIAYASEFAPDADGEHDTGNIHQNIRALKAECAQYRSQRDELMASLQAFLRAPSIGSNGPGSSTIVVQDFNLRAASAVITKIQGGAA